MRAHQIVSTLVRLAIEENKQPRDVTSEFLDRAAVEYLDYSKPLRIRDEIIQEAMDPRLMVQRRTLIGGPAPVRVIEEIQRSRILIIENGRKVKETQNGLLEAEKKFEKAIDAIIGSSTQN